MLLPAFIVFILCIVHLSTCAIVNITIDDTLGDPTNGQQFTYEPANTWNLGQSCDGCTAVLSPASTYDATWHDGTFRPTSAGVTGTGILSASVAFNGSAVYVFCVVTGSSVSPDGNTDMQFFIDNELVGSFTQAPNGNTTYDYNDPVYVNKTLTQVPHTFTLESGHLGQKALVLLDYLVYTTDATDLLPSSTSPSSTLISDNPTSSSLSIARSQSPSSSSSSTHKSTSTGAIVGGIIGGLAILSLSILACLLLRRKGGRAHVNTLPTGYTIEQNQMTARFTPMPGMSPGMPASSLARLMVHAQTPGTRSGTSYDDGISGSDSTPLYRITKPQLHLEQASVPSGIESGLEPTTQNGVTAYPIFKKMRPLPNPRDATRTHDPSTIPMPGLLRTPEKRPREPSNTRTATATYSLSTANTSLSTVRGLTLANMSSLEKPAVMVTAISSRAPSPGASRRMGSLPLRIETTGPDMRQLHSPVLISSVSSTGAVISSSPHANTREPRRHTQSDRLNSLSSPNNTGQVLKISRRKNDVHSNDPPLQTENNSVNESPPQYSPLLGPSLHPNT